MAQHKTRLKYSSKPYILKTPNNVNDKEGESK
jgi:hypothetical protein